MGDATLLPVLLAALALGGALLLGTAVAALVRRVRRSVVGRAPLVAQQVLELPEAGTFVLHLEAPKLSLADLGLGPLTLHASLRENASGLEVPTRAALFGVRVSGLSRDRRPLWNARIERGGGYDLRIEGLPDRPGLDKCNLVIGRPFGIAFPLTILGIVLGGGLLVLSLILLIIGLSSGGP